MILLTQEGKVYSYGYGEYGALGHGGLTLCGTPLIIKSLETRIIK